MDSKNIDEAGRAEQRAYMREWRAKNKDKVRENNAAYWRKRAERKLSAEAEQTNRETVKND